MVLRIRQMALWWVQLLWCDAVTVIMTSLWTDVSHSFLGLQLRYWYHSKAVFNCWRMIYLAKHGFMNSSNGTSFSFGWIVCLYLLPISWSKTIKPRPLNTQQSKYSYQTHLQDMCIYFYLIYIFLAFLDLYCMSIGCWAITSISLLNQTYQADQSFFWISTQEKGSSSGKESSLASVIVQ
jgi:hypothetical protein